MKIAFYNHTSTVSGAEISLLLTAKYLTEAYPIIFAPEGEAAEGTPYRDRGCCSAKLSGENDQKSISAYSLYDRDAVGRMEACSSHEKTEWISSMQIP